MALSPRGSKARRYHGQGFVLLDEKASGSWKCHRCSPVPALDVACPQRDHGPKGQILTCSPTSLIILSPRGMQRPRRGNHLHEETVTQICQTFTEQVVFLVALIFIISHFILTATPFLKSLTCLPEQLRKLRLGEVNQLDATCQWQG